MTIHYAVKRLLIDLKLLGLLLLILTGCGTTATQPTPTADIEGAVIPLLTAVSGGTPEPESTSDGSGRGRDGIVTTLVVELNARTPEPTATPPFIEREVDRIAFETGVEKLTFLGLTGTDWINIAISIAIFLLGYVLFTNLLYRLLKRTAVRTGTTFDDDFFETVGTELKRIVGLILLNFAIVRLEFMPAQWKLFLNEVIFILGVILVVIVSLKLVNFATERYVKSIRPDVKEAEQYLDPAIALLRHTSYVFIIVIGILIGLAHFGIDINLLSAVVLVVGFAIVLGARAILADLVAGFIILAGRPFRVGDAIQLQGWPEYGFVEVISTRATHVRTLDNREVIVPNSATINGNLVNYSTPDTTLRVQTDLRIAYHADLSQIRQLITDTLRDIKEVLPDKPVEILFREFGNSTRLIQVRWWIADLNQEYYIVDDVNSAIEVALNKAGFEIPHTTLDLNLNQMAELQQMLSKPMSKVDGDAIG